jgi:hypothetical protein
VGQDQKWDKTTIPLGSGKMSFFRDLEELVLAHKLK